MKMYVLVLKSLSKSQQAVQAGHALAEFLLKQYNKEELPWKNGDLVYLKATWAELMIHTSDKMNGAVAFYEPDMRGEITAVAMLGDDKDPRFRGFRLV